MFAYCLNNPVVLVDTSGNAAHVCFTHDGQLHDAPWKDSGGGGSWVQKVEPRQRIAIIYDGRHSGYLFGVIVTEKGFAQQGAELAKRLSCNNDVETYAYSTIEEFVECWNSLSGHYGSIYIIGHGWSGALQCNGQSFGPVGSDYLYSDLDMVSVSTIYLYCCNGATEYASTKSIAWNFANMFGAPVESVKDGKLGFTWYGCYRELPVRNSWITVFPE